MKCILLSVVVLLPALITGCCAPCPTIKAYTGPTDTMAKVVTDINANNAKVPTLSAHHYYSADVVDEKKHSHHVSGDGVLLYITPVSLRLRAGSIVGTIFEIGSNLQSYWLLLGPQAGDTMWWGNYIDLEKMDPDEIGIPIRPDMVLDVLGFSTINQNFNAQPAPTMRFDPYADAYVFLFNQKLPSRWVATREVWYDRATKLPKLVLVYDTNGRVVLRAEFNNPKYTLDGRPRLEMQYYRQVEVPGTPKAQWPWIPGNYNLTFPENGSQMTFTLDEAYLTRKDGDLVLPDPRSFRMPSVDQPDVKQLIQIGKPAAN